MSGWPITATGPDSGVSTPSLIVVPSNPGPLLTSAAPALALRLTLVGGAAAPGKHQRQHRDDGNEQFEARVVASTTASS